MDEYSEPLPRPSVLRHLALLCALFVLEFGLLLACYQGAFRGPFVFDDVASIVSNPSMPAETGLRGMFSAFEEGTTGGRPLLNASLAIDYRLWGPNPFPFRIVNIAIHALNGVLVALAVYLFLIAGFWSWGREAVLTAALVSLCWILHPLMTNTAAYVVQRAESLASFFYLGAVISAVCFIQASGRSLLLFAVSGSCALASGLTKEIAATIPLTVTLLHFFLASRDLKPVFNRRWLAVMGATCLAVIPPVAFTLVDARRSTAGFTYAGVSEWDYFRAEHRVIWFYAKNAIWPNPLAFDYGWPNPANGFSDDLYSLVYAAVAVLSFRLVLRRRVLGLLILGYWIVLLPSSSFIPINDFAFDHRSYLASVWILAPAIYGFVLAVRKVRTEISASARPLLNGLALIFIGLSVFALAAGTYQRVDSYATEIGLWTDTTLRRPKNARAFNNLGVFLMNANRPEEAEKAYIAAIGLTTDYSEPRNNLAGVLLSRGDLAGARDLYAEAVRLKPGYHEAYDNYGRTLLTLGDDEGAIKAFQRACDLRPDIHVYREHLESGLRIKKRRLAREAVEREAETEVHEAVSP